MVQDLPESEFDFVDPLDPPGYLADRILAGIKVEKELIILKRRLVAYSASIAGLLAVLVLVLAVSANELAASEFTDFAALLFSDPLTVFLYWREFGLSLLESLPATYFISALAAAFVSLSAIKVIGLYTGRIREKFYTLQHLYGSH